VSMLVSGLPTVVIASVIVHNTNADHAYYNWDITRCRKSECKIGIDSISQASRKRLTNVIRSYTHQCDLPPEQPLTLKVDWISNPVDLLDTRPAVASS